MLDGDAELVAERLDQQWRRGRAAGHDPLHRRQLLAAGAQVLQQAEPDGRHAAGHRHAFLVEQAGQAGAVQMPPGQHQRRPGQRRGVGDAPGIDVEHRHDRQDAAGGAQVEHVRQRDRIGVDHRGAVAVQHALRPPGGAGGVAERARGVLVEVRPGIVIVGRVHQLVVAEQAHAARQFERRHAGRIGHHHDGAHAVRDLRGDAADQRGEPGIDEQHAVAGVVDDVGDVVGREARIDRVADRPHAGASRSRSPDGGSRSMPACRRGPAA